METPSRLGSRRANLFTPSIYITTTFYDPKLISPLLPLSHMVGNTYVRPILTLFLFHRVDHMFSPTSGTTGGGILSWPLIAACPSSSSNSCLTIENSKHTVSSDGFALNVGRDDWQPARVADAYQAARDSGRNFKLFLSFDMRLVTPSRFLYSILTFLRLARCLAAALEMQTRSATISTPTRATPTRRSCVTKSSSPLSRVKAAASDRVVSITPGTMPSSQALTLQCVVIFHFQINASTVPNTCAQLSGHLRSILLQ